MYRSVLMFMVALLWAGLANAAPLVGFSPDGSGVAPYDDVIGFDWLPGNTLVVDGSEAISTFINTSATFDLGGGIFAFAGGDKIPMQVNYQAELAAIQLDGGETAPPVHEVTIVFGFTKQVSRLTLDINTGLVTTTFSFLSGGSNYVELWADNTPNGGAGFGNADALNGTGYNDGALIMEGVITGDSFTSNFTWTHAPLPNPLDQAGVDNYDGTGNNPGPYAPANQGPIDTIDGSGSIRLIALIVPTTVDTDYFFDPVCALDISRIGGLGFVTTQSLPFLTVDPSARFVLSPGGVEPVLASAGIVPDGSHSTVGLGITNGGLSGKPFSHNAVASGPDIQFEADGSNAFSLDVEAICVALGDMNNDGLVNGLDVDPFVNVLLNGPYRAEADMNEDQVVNGLDVDPFVTAVVGGVQQIPEPSTLLLCLVALGLAGGWFSNKQPGVFPVNAHCSRRT